MCYFQLIDEVISQNIQIKKLEARNFLKICANRGGSF